MLSQHTPSDPVSLKRRILNAGAWTLAGYGLSQALRFGTNLLLTRLLIPKMFGIMAIANIVLVGLAMFSDLGIRLNIVQSRRGNDPAFLNTAWIVQIARALLLWPIAVGIALFIAFANHLGIVPVNSAYADPQLPSVIAVLSFVTVITGFASTKQFEARRKLAFGRVTLIGLAAQIVAIPVMLGWVFLDRSIWAMVAGSIFGALTTTILTHWWLPGTANRWQWDTSAFWEIFHFGKWLFLSSILGFLAINSDRLLLGGILDATLLGVYAIAYNIFSAAEQTLTQGMAGATFPALSEIARERPEKLKASYYRIHLFVASVAFFCSGVLMTSGQSLIGLLYDPRYANAGWMLEILAANLLTVPFQISMQCFTALGMTNLYSSISMIRLIAVFVAMPLGFHLFGISGALWGLVSSWFLCLPAIILYRVRLALFDFRRELLVLPVFGFGIVIGKIIAIMISGHT